MACNIACSEGFRGGRVMSLARAASQATLQANTQAYYGSSKDLVERVLSRDHCSGCGLCVGLCPYLKNIREHTVLIHPCGLDDGNCFKICPQIDPIRLELAKGDPLGSYRSIHYARATDAEAQRRGQYGGVTSALTCFALESGLIDGALLTGGGGSEYPRPVVAHTRDEVLACAGSKYTAAPTLMAFHRAAREHRSLGIVGRPCQVAATRRLQERGPQWQSSAPHHSDLGASKIGLVIGVFCFWALDPAFHRLAARYAAGRKIVKFDIPKNLGPVLYVLPHGTVEAAGASGAAGVAFQPEAAPIPVPIPMEEIRPLIKQSCLSCPDVTSELADISVGSTEHLDEYNTLIARTEAGEQLVKKAVAAGVIEIMEYPAERLPLLVNAVANKKKRVEVAASEISR